jgi:hypothetical protein
MRASIILTLLSLLLFSSSALAQDEASVDVRFWGFSSNPQFFAYQTTNHLDAEMFFVGQAGSADPVYSEAATEDRSPRDILISRDMRDTYGWNSDGVRGAVSPSEYSEIIVRETGPTLSVTAVQGRNRSPIGAIARLMDQNQTEYASFEVIDVIWSTDETVVVVIIEQRLGGNYPARIQTAQGFAVPARPAPAPAPAPGQ